MLWIVPFIPPAGSSLTSLHHDIGLKFANQAITVDESVSDIERDIYKPERSFMNISKEGFVFKMI
jgi:hypothetical protein